QRWPAPRRRGSADRCGELEGGQGTVRGARLRRPDGYPAAHAGHRDGRRFRHYVGPDAPGRRPGWVKTTRTLGIIVAIAGAGSVAFSTTRNAVRVEDQRLPLLVGGIAGVTLGGGAFIGSYLFDPTRSHKDEVARSPQW